MRIKKTSQYIEGGASLSNVYGTSNEDGYTQQYINTELNKKLTNETVSSTINNCKFYKMGNLVIAFGWFTLNSDTGSFIAPYKPIMRTWIPVNGVNNQLEASSVHGYINIQTDGALNIKMTGTVTHCTTTFCYLTND